MTPPFRPPPYRYRHRFPDGCGDIAFYLDRRPYSWENLTSDIVTHLDGTRATPNSLIICGTCKKIVWPLQTNHVEKYDTFTTKEDSMNTEPPYDLRLWDELSPEERDRYLPLTDEELAEVTPLTEDQRRTWLLTKRMEGR